MDPHDGFGGDTATISEAGGHIVFKLVLQVEADAASANKHRQHPKGKDKTKFPSNANYKQDWQDKVNYINDNKNNSDR